MALDTLYTSATYDSFFTVVEMDEFIQEIKFSHGGDQKWLALSEEEKENLTKSAVRYINSNVWAGTQNILIIVKTMLWPRDPYGDTTPNDIGLAMACHILRTLNGGGESLAAIGAVKKKKVGNVEIEYETGGGATSAVQSGSKPCADEYAHYYLISKTSGGIGGVGLNKVP